MATLCSGIGAPEVAASRVGGFESVFVAEIESFPCAVLAHHYPNVPNYGDMTKWRDWPAHDLDLLVAGTPCQAFSVAGLRNSLDDDRGNLTLEMARYANHARPRFLLWENVPGVLNTKDDAFGCLLGALAGSDAPLLPDGGRWSNEGFVAGPRRQIAWRVLDAQFFGVAQRRRRVWLVAGDVERGAGNWRCAAALFPVGEGLRWHPSAGGAAGEGVAGWVAPSLTGSGRGTARTGDSRGQDCVIPATGYRKPAHGYYADDDTASAMKARDYKGETDVIASVTSKWAKGSGGPSGDECQNLVSHTLRAEGHDASEDGTGRGTPLVATAFQSVGYGTDAAANLSPTLRSHDPMAVVTPSTVAIRTAQTGANGHGVSHECAHTLDRAQGQAVAVHDMRGNGDGATVPTLTGDHLNRATDYTPCVAFSAGNSGKAYGIGAEVEMSPPLRAANSGTNQVPSVAFQQNTRDEVRLIAGDGQIAGAIAAEAGDPCHPLAAGADAPLIAASHTTTTGDHYVTTQETNASSPDAQVVHWAQGGGEVEDNLSGALRANAEHSYQFVRLAPSLTATNDPSRSPQSSEVTYFGMDGDVPANQDVSETISTREGAVADTAHAVMSSTYAARRLTVGECERLQGFPNGYTAVQHRGKPAADGPRYKALGNSMAVPCVEFILAHLKATTTGGGE